MQLFTPVQRRGLTCGRKSRRQFQVPQDAPLVGLLQLFQCLQGLIRSGNVPHRPEHQPCQRAFRKQPLVKLRPPLDLFDLGRILARPLHVNKACQRRNILTLVQAQRQPGQNSGLHPPAQLLVLFGIFTLAEFIHRDFRQPRVLRRPRADGEHVGSKPQTYNRKHRKICPVQIH